MTHPSPNRRDDPAGARPSPPAVASPRGRETSGDPGDTLTPPDWAHPWRLLAASLRTLWRLGASRRVLRRFVLLYLAVVTVLVGLGSAFLLMFLGVLRAVFLAAPLYPRLVAWLRWLGWEPPPRMPAARSPWRTLHTALWIALSGGAVLVGLWVLVNRGFCAQNWLCKLGLLRP